MFTDVLFVLKKRLYCSLSFALSRCQSLVSLSVLLSILLISLVFIFTDEYCKLRNIPYEFHVCGCSFFLVFDLRTQAVSNEEKFRPCEALMNNLKRA